MADEVKVTVDGMVCSFCAQGIKRAFSEVLSVDTVDINLDQKLVTLVTKKDHQLKDEEITSLIKDSGYEVVKIERNFARGYPNLPANVN